MSEIKLSGTTVIDNTGGTVTVDANQLQIGGTTVIDNNKKLSNVDIVPNSSFMFRNKIINGGMHIAQRGTSFSFAHDGTTSGHTLDRFQFVTGNTDEYDCTVSQYSMSTSDLNTTGHSNALKLLTGTAELAIVNNEQVHISYKIEAQDLQDLQYGTTSAKTVTLSFWVKSSVTGTYAVAGYKDDSTTRIINRTYTINSADTWEKKTISIVGDTDSTGSIVNDSGEGLRIVWALASGSDFNSSSSTTWTNYSNAHFLGGHVQNGVVTTANADWYLTGVQLEEGTVATPFEHRPIGMELSLCQRYTTTIGNGYFAGNGAGSSAIVFGVPLCVPLRGAPSIEKIGGANISIHRSGNNTNANATVTVSAWKENATVLKLRTSHSSSDESVYSLNVNNSFLVVSEL